MISIRDRTSEDDFISIIDLPIPLISDLRGDGIIFSINFSFYF